MYLVYILSTHNSNLYYVGMTNNFLRRWLQHNQILSGGAKFTKKSNGWYPICIIDGFNNKSEAMQCEWKLKNRRYKLSKKLKGDIGRITYLNLLLLDEKWTSKSPNIVSQKLTIYIDDEYKHLLTHPSKELYWKL